MSKVIVSYSEEWYDVTAFSHPGDGIKGIYLENFNGKRIDEELHNEHMTNEPYEYLEEAKEKGECEGIIYLGKKEEKKEEKKESKNNESVDKK